MTDITPEEFSDRLQGHVTARTIRNWCRDGMIPGARKIGRAWLIPEKEAEKIISKGLPI